MKQLKFNLIVSLLLITSLLPAQLSYDAMMSNVIQSYPENIGGEREFKRFIQDHLVYPKSALENKTEGKVTIRCEITKTGEPLEPTILVHLTPETDYEALRLFRLLKWSPAISSLTKKAVNSNIDVIIPFNLKKYTKACKLRNFTTPVFTDKPADSTNHVPGKVDKIPTYYYGADSLKKYIATNLTYPELARRHGIEGTVMLEFIVETNGKISTIFVENELGAGCTQEAIELIAKTFWTPAILNNTYVRFKHKLPITFKMNGKLFDNSSKDQTQQ